jgi:hypothetical protein
VQKCHGNGSVRTAKESWEMSSLTFVLCDPQEGDSTIPFAVRLIIEI